MVRCHVLSVLGCENNENKRVIKESFLLFSRDKLILDKKKLDRFGSSCSGYSYQITYDSSGISFSIISFSMLVLKILKPLLPVDEVRQPES